MFKFIKYFNDKKLIAKDRPVDSEGRAIVDIKIKDKSEVISPFVIDGQEIINAEFANLIDNTMKSIPPTQNININIDCEKLTDKDKSSFALAIKNYYKNSTLDSQRKMDNNTKILLLMLALSITSLAALFLVNFFSVNWLVIEIVDIVAWVFIWESIDLLVFQRSLVRYEKLRYLSLYNCHITYKH